MMLKYLLLCLFLFQMACAPPTEKDIYHKIVADRSISENKSEADALLQKGIVLYSTNDFKNAETTYEKVIVVHEHLLEDDDPQLGEDYNTLGYISKSLDKLDNAEEYFKRALSIFEKAKGADSEQVANLESNLGEIYFLKKNYGEAEKRYNKAMAVYEKMTGSQGKILQAFTMNGMAAVYRQTNRAAEADALEAKAKAILPPQEADAQAQQG